MWTRGRRKHRREYPRGRGRGQGLDVGIYEDVDGLGR